MKAIIWILKIYLWILFAWVIMSWLFMIPGMAQLRSLLGTIVWPVVAPFSFLKFGGISLAPIIPAFLLYWIIGYLETNYGEGPGQQPWQEPPPENDNRPD